LATYWQLLPSCDSLDLEVTVMDTMNIALPESLKMFVQEQVERGGYSSVSEYVRELIRAEQRRRHEEEVDRLLLEGIQSGSPIEVTPEYWEAKKKRLAARLSQARKP
jgi:antitoxin ParD1/3/4